MTEQENEDEQEYISAANPAPVDFKSNADYHISVTISDNVLSWAGDTINCLAGCDVPSGKLNNIQKKFISFLSQNDPRRTFAAAKIFRKIVSQETANKVWLQLLKENGTKVI